MQIYRIYIEYQDGYSLVWPLKNLEIFVPVLRNRLQPAPPERLLTPLNLIFASAAAQP